MATYQESKYVSLGDEHAMKTEEVQELEKYLGIGPLKFNENLYHNGKCPKCKRRLIFTGLLNAARLRDPHTKSYMAKILQGEMGYLMTIKGEKDNIHNIIYINCGTNNFMVDKCQGYNQCGWK
jgi:hypothetical protein